MSTVRVSLTGGPDNFPDELRTHLVADLGETVKVGFHGGYEHFAHDGEYIHDGVEKVAVYQWSGRTRVAE